MKYIMDTHAWIWWNMNPDKLSKKVKIIISNVKGYEELLLSTISVWEFCKLVEKGRLVIACDPEEWIKQAIDMPKLRIIQLTPAISYRSTMLPQPFHNEPADQIIVAAAREENATILTCDERLRNYKYIKTVW